MKKYRMNHPTISPALNEMYQMAAEAGFGLGGMAKFAHINTQSILDVINEVNSHVRTLRGQRDSLRKSLTDMESLHIQAAVSAKGIKEKSAHYEAASDARRALSDGDE